MTSFGVIRRRVRNKKGGLAWRNPPHAFSDLDLRAVKPRERESVERLGEGRLLLAKQADHQVLALRERGRGIGASDFFSMPKKMRGHALRVAMTRRRKRIRLLMHIAGRQDGWSEAIPDPQYPV